MSYDKDWFEEIDDKYGIPKKEISCPSCGRKYGHHKTNVCKSCEECSSCCGCENQELIDSDNFIKDFVLPSL